MFLLFYYTTLAQICKRFFRVLRLLFKNFRAVRIGFFIVCVKAVFGDFAVFLCLVFVVALALFKLFAALHFCLFFLGYRLQRRYSFLAFMQAHMK